MTPLILPKPATCKLMATRFVACGEDPTYANCSDECWAYYAALSRNRITPWVSGPQNLLPIDVFTFGSNEGGRHTKGAALVAAKCGAVKSIPSGLSGQTFAIPTKPADVRISLCLRDISKYVAEFIEYAAITSNRCFLITEIGCGLAGYAPKDIAPMFRRCVDMSHVCLPQRFWEVL